MKKAANNKLSKNAKIMAVFCLICAVILFGCVNKGVITKADNGKA
jgi:hypothetical protein